MTKKEFIDYIKTNKEIMFKKDIFFASLLELPSNYRNEMLRVAHLKYVHEGRFVQLVHVQTQRVFYYATTAEALDFIKENYYPKAVQENIYRALNRVINTTAGFEVNWVTDKELI